MTLLVPRGAQVIFLERILAEDCKLKLYSNNVTPALGNTLATYTEVTGGGYADITLEFAEWTISEGDPSIALYSDFQDWNFTGATGGAGTIYGYYVTNDAEDELLWAERFDEDDVPFSPVNGSLIRVRPRLAAQNLS